MTPDPPSLSLDRENDGNPPPLPLLIVVTGRPASGKTTLSHTLARAVRCPLVSRDEIKEGFVNTTGEAGGLRDETGRRVYAAFFETITLLLRHRVSLVAEAAFQHKLWAPALEPLREAARIRVVVCAVDTERARARFIARGQDDPERARFHLVAVAQASEGSRDFLYSDYDPPRLDVPTLTVDTTDGYRPDFEAVVAFARGETLAQ